MNPKIVGAVLATVLAVPFAAQAQYQNQQSALNTSYLGLNVGSTDQKLRVDGFGSRTDSNTGVKLYGGYGFNENFGLEAGFVDFGKGRLNSASSKPQALYLAATGTLPVNDQFSLFAKAGLAASRTKLQAPGYSRSENRATPVIGVGAAFNFSPNVAMVVEYEDFGKVAKKDGFNIKANMASVGVRYKFD